MSFQNVSKYGFVLNISFKKLNDRFKPLFEATDSVEVLNHTLIMLTKIFNVYGHATSKRKVVNGLWVLLNEARWLSIIAHLLNVIG